MGDRARPHERVRLTGAAAEDPRVERLRAHVEWLVDPARAGRRVGTAAERAVVEDLARRFSAAGLEPAGSDGFLHPVPLVRCRSGASAATLSGAGGERWVANEEAVAVRCASETACRASGPAALLHLEPPRPPLETTSPALRLERLLRVTRAPSGAIPVVLVEPGDWQAARAGLAAPRFRAADETPGGAGGTAPPDPPAVILDAGAAPAWVRAGVAEPIVVEASGAVDVEPATGWNVAGLVRGADPGLAREAVVLTAHHDHLGTHEVGGRTVVHPGAVDNALSVAELVETGRALAGGPRPPRSIVLLATTAEEVGFLGARRWLADPPAGAPRPIASWNHDGASEAWGRAETAVVVVDAGFPLASLVHEVAAAAGIRLVDNPFPSEGFFFRSDHYVFAAAGIPAALVFLGPEYAGRPAGWGIGRAAAYLREAYHQPGDGPDQIESWEGAVQYMEFWAELARATAGAPPLER